jgi:SAM-dependent methyltransferase
MARTAHTEPISNQSAGESTIRIDVGCGSAKRPGFLGLDNTEAPGVDYVLDLTRDRFPFDDNTVEYVFSSHFLEHVAAPNHVLAEIGRVCKDGAKIEIWTPYAFSDEAFLYGHQTFLTELHWMHFCYEHRDAHLPILGGRWLLRNLNYVVLTDTAREIANHKFSVDFAIRYFKSVVAEFGVEIEFRRNSDTPPVMPIRTYSHSRDGQRFPLNGDQDKPAPDAEPQVRGSLREYIKKLFRS